MGSGEEEHFFFVLNIDIDVVAGQIQLPLPHIQVPEVTYLMPILRGKYVGVGFSICRLLAFHVRKPMHCLNLNELRHSVLLEFI